MSRSDWDDDINSGEIGSEFDQGMSKWSHLLLFTIVLFFVVFGIWAHTATLDEVTRGDGKIVPSRQIQKVQNIIKELSRIHNFSHFKYLSFKF